MKETRSSINQAEANETGASFMMVEFIIISLAIVIFTKSWTIGGATFLFFIICSWISKLLTFLLIVLTLAWPVVVWVVIDSFEGGIGAKLIFSILALLLALGNHVNAFQWVKDINK